MERNSKRRYWENKASRPLAAREETKRELAYELEKPELGRLISRAEAVYDRLTGPSRTPAPER